MTPEAETVVVLAKSPRPGFVKTRLQPTFSADEAAALAAAAIRDTLDAVVQHAPKRIVVAWDGPAVTWLPRRALIVPQRGSSLDERLENVFADVFSDVGGASSPTLLVGMDTPQLVADDLDIDWGSDDAVLGPSCDGGYWAIGFRRHVPGTINGVAMSTARTGADQLARLRAYGLSVGLLPVKRDVDEASDAAEVSALAPRSRFGRLHRRLVESPCSPTTLFEAALSGHSIEVRSSSHEPVNVGPLALETSAWQRMSAADEVLLSRCVGPVLDLGCGPGRFVEALGALGVAALGVDVSRDAVDQTRARGAAALVRDINDRLPAEGRWGTVLLADGNIGIGGDPLALLRRCREILRPGAAALVETSPDDHEDRRTVITLHGPTGRRSTPVPWAVLGSRALVELAAMAGFVTVEDWRVEGRAFVMLRHAG